PTIAPLSYTTLFRSEGRGERPLRGRGLDVAEVGHLADDLVAPLQRPARVEERVVDRGRLRQSGQQRRLRHGQLAGGGVEEDPRRSEEHTSELQSRFD